MVVLKQGERQLLTLRHQGHPYYEACCPFLFRFRFPAKASDHSCVSRPNALVARLLDGNPCSVFEEL